MDYIISRDDSDYLEHHGVKGMHWGIRKEPERTGNGRSKRGSVEDKKAAKLAKREARGAAKLAKREAREANQRAFRNDIANVYNTTQKEEDSRIRKQLNRRVGEAQARLDYAKQRGASQRKVNRLERKVTENKIRADIINSRNKYSRNAQTKYMRDNVGTARALFTDHNARIKEQDRVSYDKAVAYAKNKYGNEAVKKYQRKENAKTIAAGAAVIGTYAAVLYLSESEKNKAKSQS